MKLKSLKNIFMVSMVSIAVLVLSGCLRTRSEVSPGEQSYLSRKKQNENQMLNSGNSIVRENTVDPEETIRTLNGRIEILENHVTQLQKENVSAANSADSARIGSLQDALSKMELQLQKLEAEKGLSNADPKQKSSDENLKSNLPSSEGAPANTSKKSAYEQAEDFFDKKEWKKAILTYQKFADEFPKSKLIPDAKYKTGVAFQELGLKDEALAFYEEVHVQYPQTLAGKKAKIRMANLTPKASGKSKKK